MTFEEAAQAWKHQMTPQRSSAALDELIRRNNTRSNRRLIISTVFLVLCVAAAVLNFYGQHVVNGDGLLVSSLRAFPVLVAAVIQMAVVDGMKRSHKQRLSLTANQHQWLANWTSGLEIEVGRRAFWGPTLLLLLVLIIVSATKMIDYQNGDDTLGECIGVVLAFASCCAIVPTFLWHYRTQFLIPELRRCRELSRQLDDA